MESTLAGKSLARWLERAKAEGYEVSVIYVMIDSPEKSLERVKERVSRGGHDVPEACVLRRFHRTAQNFWHVYREFADLWISITIKTVRDCLWPQAVSTLGSFTMMNYSTNFCKLQETDMAGVSALTEKQMQKHEEFTRIMKIPVDKAIPENRRLGILMYQEIDGVAHWELPDGTLTIEDPWPAIEAKKKAAEASE